MIDMSGTDDELDTISKHPFDPLGERSANNDHFHISGRFVSKEKENTMYKSAFPFRSEPKSGSLVGNEPMDPEKPSAKTIPSLSTPSSGLDRQSFALYFVPERQEELKKKELKVTHETVLCQTT